MKNARDKFIHKQDLVHQHKGMPAPERYTLDRRQPIHQRWLVCTKACPLPAHILRQKQVGGVGGRVALDERLCVVELQQPGSRTRTLLVSLATGDA